MSLFLCMKCGVVENHSCCSSKVETDISNYPHMGLMDMQGYGDDIYVLDMNNEPVLFKEKSEVMMLCSQCNTGIWHNEFERKIPDADSDDVYLSKYSGYNYTTISDHPAGVVKRNGDGTFSLSSPKLKDFADWIISGYNKHYKTNETNVFKIAKNDIRVRYILDLLLENMDSFECTVTERLFDEAMAGDAVYQLSLFAKDCIPDSRIANSKVISMLERYIAIARRNNIQPESVVDEFVQLERFVILSTQIERNHGRMSFEDNILEAIASLSSITGVKTNQDELKELLESVRKNSGMYSKHKKPHWKETQSEDDKNEKLRKAEEKRLRKLNKK